MRRIVPAAAVIRLTRAAAEDVSGDSELSWP
jgi:hypothetical protein